MSKMRNNFFRASLMTAKTRLFGQARFLVLVSFTAICVSSYNNSLSYDKLKPEGKYTFFA